MLTALEVRLAPVRLASWRPFAACAGMTQLFYDASPAAVALALDVCSSCAVRQPCLAAALAEEAGQPARDVCGVRGGLTPRQRGGAGAEPLELRPCDHCGVLFAPGAAHARWCSGRCSVGGHRREHGRSPARTSSSG